MDVCVKIIKNNKDFFDQSLDEIKLLKFVNKHDPADKYHLLRLYDYFYYRVSENFVVLRILYILLFYASGNIPAAKPFVQLLYRIVALLF